MGNNRQGFKLSVHATTYSAELYAILQVLININNSNNRRYTIFTDSKRASKMVGKFCELKSRRVLVIK